MYYWTFQHKSVRETIEKNGYYLPDFSYVFGSYFMEDPYRLALCAFKRNNPSFRVLRGLVFAFERDLNKPFETVEEIQEFFDENPGDFLFIKKRTDEYDMNGSYSINYINWERDDDLLQLIDQSLSWN